MIVCSNFMYVLYVRGTIAIKGIVCARDDCYQRYCMCAGRLLSKVLYVNGTIAIKGIVCARDDCYQRYCMCAGRLLSKVLYVRGTIAIKGIVCARDDCYQRYCSQHYINPVDIRDVSEWVHTL